MYRTKKDVDKHVESLITKLSVKEFKTRAYSVARLYFEVGDYASCQRYVEQYLAQKDNNAAAHKLLGQALQKLGQKEKALEQYKFSLDIDPTQTSTILDICELLADDDVAIDPGRAKFWCEKAEAIFPRHPVTFRLRERLVTIANPDPEALVKLLIAELTARPKDAALHARLLKHYLQTNQIKEALNHSCNVEFSENTFFNNYAWYSTLAEILKHNFTITNDWLYQLLLLTVRERICVLSLTETPSGSSKSLIESNELLHAYDQALESVAKAGAPQGFGEFHASLMQHHRGQFAFHAATYLLKKAKKDQLSWRDATRCAAPLMLIAWQTVPLDSKVNWLTHAPEKQQIAVHRWYTEGTYRCCQAGHYLLANIQDKSQTFLDRISQCCSGSHWRDKLYEKIFTSRDHLAKIKTSHFVTNAYNTPVLRLPRRIEVEAYDGDAQKEYPNSLHHFVWTLLNYKNFAHFKCTLFDMLTPTATNLGPETLNKLDIHAFLYCAALTARQRKSSESTYFSSDKPAVLPANITDLLCSLTQMKWWDCAYKFSQNELGSELTDIRATISRGMEVVRCVDNHGLDPELLCIVGSIFSERAKLTTAVEEKNQLEIRAGLYYSSAIPLLEKLKSKLTIKMHEKRLFDYTHKELGTKELNALIEESKLYVAVNYLNDGEYEKAIEMISNLKSPEACYHLSVTYKKLALEENNLSRENNSSETKSKYATLMLKAKSFAFKALDKMKETDMSKNHPLYSEVQQLIEEIETALSRIEYSSVTFNDVDGKYSSDENISSGGSEHLTLRNNYQGFVSLSSTPKQLSNSNATNYRTAVDSHVLETTRPDPQIMDRIENQIKSFQKRLADDIMEQNKSWFEENRKLGNQIMEQTKTWLDENRRSGNQIMGTIQSDIQHTADQLKLLKISVDHVKDQIDECRNECKDVGDIKKQIAELKKEVNKLKKASSEPTIDESDLYNLEEEYRTNDSTSNFTAQLPFQTQVLPPFNQRLVPPFPVPPNPYQLYSQNLYNLYNQYSQFAQTPSVPGTAPLFDPTRASVNYAGVYPSPDQMFLDVAQFVPPTVPAAPSVPTVPPVPVVQPLSSVPSVPISVPPPTTSVAPAKPVEAKEIPRSLPVNVVITSSDPLPTCTTAPAPILSVTIPPKHIKGTTPHNYQIQMPPANDTKIMSPPVFSFPAPGNKATATTASTLINWNQANLFKTSQAASSNLINTESSFFSSKTNESINNSKSVVDGPFSGVSPNTSLNKSRTLSERSNTSVDNYDPCPDFKPIIPLPAEVQVTTGEENETVIFSARAKLFRFVDKQWKERGIGEMKLLKHNATQKVRVLMRREQIHKICANHIIVPDMEIKPVKNETKAYFWVANDFADESVVLEKFSIRFKTADIALQFYETFEKARLESKEIPNTSKAEVTVSAPEITLGPLSTPVKVTTSFTATSQPSKTEFGGFTFSSTPTFKTVQDSNKVEIKISEPTTTKVNVFSSLTFKTTTTSPFSNIFNTSASPVTNVSSPVSKQPTPSKLNTSDVLEEFEPNVEFKPVVPLPALIDQKTGEEDEIVLFEHRAKLLRYDASTKEWKERGLGNIKLLVYKDNVQKVRLLMRREQIMKVCCNHAVTKDVTFQKMPKVDKAVTWCAKDFSDGELVSETFCLRFKTVQACDDFITAVKTAQLKMKDDSKALKEEENAAKQSGQTGFGDKFKSKPGSWYCEGCYTNNLERFLKCACCEQPRPQASESPIISSQPTSGWGDKFKPKAGSWECNACLIRNDANIDYCTACNSPKDPDMPQNEKTPVSDNPVKYNFGIPLKDQTTPTVATTDFGDKFKLKEGSWECKQCFVRNEGNTNKCVACTSLRDPNAATDETKSIFGSTLQTGPKFSFGIPQSSAEEQKSKTTSIFDGTGGHKFSFGIPSNAQENSSNVMAFGEQKSKQVTSGTDAPVNLSSKVPDSQSIPVTPAKPALLPTPQAETTTFGSKEGGTFDFVFKPKTPKGKSPMKSPKSEKGDESDGNEYASEDEGHHIHFSPVIPLPDKVEVVTGEESETELYGHRAKLFRFMSGEWKERGIGVVKILKHKDTNKLRVVMRREQVHKICLNHALTYDITYTAKDDKTWLFAANDFSEEALSLQKFCLRFKTKDIALQFKDAIEKARDGKPINQTGKESDKKDSDSDDVIFVREILATTEEKQKANELLLPENFFTYKNKEPCTGCRGCRDDDDDDEAQPKKDLNFTNVKVSTIVSSSSMSTPVRTTTSPFLSPMNSFYGTPANFDKTFDTSVFRTPLGSMGSNTNSVQVMTPLTSTSDNSVPDKENTLVHKNIVGVNNERATVSAPLQSKTVDNIVSVTQASGFPNSATIFTPTNLKNLPKSVGESQPTEQKLWFGTIQNKPDVGQIKSVFGNTNTGLSTNKSIFGFNLESKKDDKEPTEVKSIFGTDEKPVNLFSGVNQGSIFGPGALQMNNQPKLSTNIFGPPGMSTFGSNALKPQTFGNENSLFSSKPNQTLTWSFGSNTEQKKPDDTATVAPSEPKTEVVKLETDVSNEKLFNVDNTLSFAALSASVPDFNIQKKSDFKWEGAGQPLFVSGQKSSSNQADKSKNESGAADDSGAGPEEEYDPHYEPIVPLPDKIVVTTGEEDEEKLFGERSKLYRYDDKAREWKERGVGEMKILFHPERNTYRLLLRREQVHKAVLNMLIPKDMELRPMKNSDRAWTWAGLNFAENQAGEQETLAVRFKSVDLATSFHEKVVECVRKLQATPTQPIKEEKENSSQPVSVPPLRLPKHLEDSARADATLTAQTSEHVQLQQVTQDTTDTLNGELNKPESKQVHFQEPQDDHEEEEEDYDHDYDHNEDYDAYYNDEEEESATYYVCDGEAIVQQGETLSSCEQAHVQVMFDQEIYSPKILVTDIHTGEILADMLIHTDTEFQMSGDSCSWSGTDYTSNDPVDKTVTINFPDADTAMQFYDSCETSKGATYSSTDPES